MKTQEKMKSKLVVPPWNGDRKEWKNVSQIAELYDKKPVTIYKWFSQGFMSELGWKVFRDATGHWFARQ